MKIHLEREYWPGGTNGTMTIEDFKLCHTIELPWKRNEKEFSCIPEGVYVLEKRFSERHGWHIALKDVPGRSLILIHSANNAGKELKGCIAPVTKLKGEGIGLQSRHAFEKLKEMIYSVIDGGEEVILEIRSYPDAALNLVQYERSWMD
ncbi:hypothetical protein KIH41_16280 [Litoribacter ruber]|uniref:DUF5675 family protein n=1 Tax=Litoribacter ruber TaxID=702568 RepID=UPI001BD9B558|nr:DUF5675 family protein [Litoribacter ruber]MBT0812845.1 hypothetical protein [Litoribacter ruber]